MLSGHFALTFAGTHLQHMTEAIMLLCHRLDLLLLKIKQYLPMTLYTTEQ